MAVLQAARAHSLGLTRDAAYSWGLNRAIFYAAAKRGFRGGSPADGTPSPVSEKAASRKSFRLGDEEAFQDPTSDTMVFAIGEQDQTVTEFEREIIARFGTKGNFRAAWEEAIQIVGGFDRSVLESRRDFYEEIYRPRRDALSDDWTSKYSPAPTPKKSA
jgi:hypothetical protein